MLLSASKLYISDTPLTKQQYSKILPLQQVQQCESINKLDLLDLNVPLISILYAYKAGPQFYGFQFQLQTELLIKTEKLSYKLIKYEKTEGYIYRLIELDSCICYQKPISCIISIKYTQNKPQQILSLTQLTSQLASRKLVIYSQKTLSTYKRDIIIKQPLSILFRYQNTEGYVWLKCINTRNQDLKIYNIQLMNWLVKDYQQVRQFKSINYLNQFLEQGVILKQQQQIGVMLTINKNLSKIQIPYLIQFQIYKYQGYRFKMIKYLYFE